MLSVACARSAPETTPSPLPVPVVAASTGAKSWGVVPWSGDAVYRFSRSGTVSSDSAGEHPVTASSNTREALTRKPALNGATFELSDAGHESPSRSGASTKKASGFLSAMQFTLDPSAGADPCDPTKAQLRTDLADLAFPLTSTIARGESWTDSVSNDACVSGIAGTARTRRQFLVIGDTAFATTTAVIVQRRDSTNLSAEGVQNRHAITLTASGAATARIYLSVPEGRLLRIQKEQLLTISVASGSQTRNFVQRSNSVGELDR